MGHDSQLLVKLSVVCVFTFMLFIYVQQQQKQLQAGFSSKYSHRSIYVVFN